MRRFFLLLNTLFFFLTSSLLCQFGQNKVQYKNFDWFYIQTKHFDIYFSEKGTKLAEFASKAAEESLTEIEKSLNHQIKNRITIIIYNSTNDFQETNVTDEYLSEGIEGFTEIFKNRVVVQFMGNYPEFRHLIHHELTHAVMNDLFYGGSFQNIITNNISLNLPQWFNEGMAEYQSLNWDINSDIFMRDAIVNELLPDIDQLQGYISYRAGESIFYYIAEKYGKEKIGELVHKIKSAGNLEEGFKEAIGLSLKEFNERWKKHLKKVYWPDIAIRKDPDDFAKRLTDPEKGGGFYNTSPTISPLGDKIAFISNRNYYFDVFIMSAIDGKIIKRLVKGNRSADFEQLNVVAPGLSWSPDENKIALSAKAEGNDIIYILNVNSDNKEILPVKLDGIKSLSWSPDGKNLAFVGHNSYQSDIYIFNFESKKITNLTDDIFNDSDPSWSPDSKKIFFASDRGNNLSHCLLLDTLKIYNYRNTKTDIYSINIANKEIERITNLPNSNQFCPVVDPIGKEMLFISDLNGINNIYKKKLSFAKNDTSKNIDELVSLPITNSINGLYQLSLSKDGKKLIFSSLFKSSYNLFLLDNPFDINLKTSSLTPTIYESELNKMRNKKVKIEQLSANIDSLNNASALIKFKNGSDSSNVYGDTIQIDFNNYVIDNRKESNSDTSVIKKSKLTFVGNLDKNGNYLVNRYKITFSPDIIYANAGYSSLFGLLGTTVLSFSDVLGNYRIIGQTSLQIDLKNSDYGLAYYNLKDRLNYGIETFHSARFAYLSRLGGANLFRFRNYGAVISLSYPLDKFYRIGGGFSWLNVTMENLDNPDEQMLQSSFLVPSLSFIHDNTLWGYTAPIDGTRYRFDVLANPGITGNNLSFYSFLGDYRTYFSFFTSYSFAFRFSGGYSDGKDPQKFFIGGMDNWINREFATVNIPLNSPSDFAFLTAALPLRGYDYAQELGSKYGLLNIEFRFPLIRYLVPGPIPILFSNIMGEAFFDAGAAWDRNSELKLFQKDPLNGFKSQDLLTGTGLGARMFFIYFLLRFDVAWAYNFNRFSQPKYYISLGTDF